MNIGLLDKWRQRPSKWRNNVALFVNDITFTGDYGQCLCHSFFPLAPTGNKRERWIIHFRVNGHFIVRERNRLQLLSSSGYWGILSFSLSLTLFVHLSLSKPNRSEHMAAHIVLPGICLLQRNFFLTLLHRCACLLRGGSCVCLN